MSFVLPTISQARSARQIGTRHNNTSPSKFPIPWGHFQGCSTHAPSRSRSQKNHQRRTRFGDNQAEKEKLLARASLGTGSSSGLLRLPTYCILIDTVTEIHRLHSRDHRRACIYAIRLTMLRQLRELGRMWTSGQRTADIGYWTDRWSLPIRHAINPSPGGTGISAKLHVLPSIYC